MPGPTGSSTSILIVDDEPALRERLAHAVARINRVHVETADSGDSALNMVHTAKPDLVILDYKLPDMNGLEVLEVLRDALPRTDVLMISGYANVSTVAAARRKGATDFLFKPLTAREVQLTVENIIADRNGRDGARAEADVPSSPIIGRHPQLLAIGKLIGAFAAGDDPVLIRGETGTGKDLVARELHRQSSHASGPFVAVNCASVTPTLLQSTMFGHTKGAFTGAASDRKGKFSIADGGTIFLDEIGDSSLEFQALLLRVLEEREYWPVGAQSTQRLDARVVLATRRDLAELVASGDFRDDLYYRLGFAQVVIPPLRERQGDIELLAEHFVRGAAEIAGIDPPKIHREAFTALRTRDWPGNVRELRNCITAAVRLATGGVIRAHHLPFGGEMGVAAGVPTSLAEAEAEHVTRVLHFTGGNKSRTARILGISRGRLDRMIQRHGIGLPMEV